MYHNHHIHETKHLKEANLLQEEKYRHLTADPVGKLVCEMAVPTIISMLVTAVYNLADTFFVGLMHSNAATGAVGVVFSLMAIIQATGFFFGQGSGNYISRQLGRHETEDAETMAITAVTLAFSAGVVVLILGQLFLQPLARLLGSTDTILPYACDYLRIILLGAPYMTASFVLNNQLRFQGSAIYSMIGIVAGAVINVGLDPLLIFTFKMGIRGAALASNMMTQTMGKTVPATILAAARQGLFFIPAVLLMPLWLDQLGVQLAQSVADVLSFALTLVMMRRVFRNLRSEENAAMLLRHHRTSDPYPAENVPEIPETP